jgi:hypothetical protein
MNTERNNECKEKREPKELSLFLESLEFIKARECFNTVELQKFLKCSFHDVMKVIDALVVLSLVEKNEDESISPRYFCKY